VQLGHVVEFQNGCLELPPSRKEAAQAEAAEDARHDLAAEAASLRETPAGDSQQQQQGRPQQQQRQQKNPQQQPQPREPKPRRDSRYALLPLTSAASLASLG
jgi:transcription initiation factor TFIID subunit TAF12